MITHDDTQLILFIGPMGAGKSKYLIFELDKCLRKKKNVIAFKPLIDDRYAINEIVSHANDRFPAIAIESANEIYQHLANMDSHPDVVGIDELFMLEGASDVVIWLFKNGIDVFVSSLDLSFACIPFGEITKIMPYATQINKMTSACVICGGDARYTYKKIEDELENEICVGGFQLYEPRCIKCHPYMHE